MSTYFKPRRGKKAKATQVLKGSKRLYKGELFFEVPDEGVGKGVGKIKMGDGASDYEDLNYFLDTSSFIDKDQEYIMDDPGSDVTLATCIENLSHQNNIPTAKGYVYRALDILRKNSVTSLDPNNTSVKISKANGGTSNIVIPYATKALQDDEGNQIKTSYAANINTSGNNINLIDKKNNTLKSITPPYAEKAKNDNAGHQIDSYYAPLASPTFTGTPTAPTPISGDNSNKLATTKFVVDTFSGYKDAEFVVVDSLPESGEKGYIYLVPKNRDDDEDEADNLYDEYIWLESKFEKIGDTKLDLSEYVNDIELITTSTDQYANAYGNITKSGNKITFNKDKTHYDKLKVSGDGNAITGLSVNGSTISATKGSTFLKQTDKISSATNADTAIYALSAGSVDWANVDNKPTSPIVVDWANVDNKPTYYNTTTALVQNFSNAVKEIKVNNALKADSAGSAGSATKATKDESGNNIKDSYGASLGTDGDLITLKNKNSTTVSTITAPYATNASTASYADSANSATQDESGNNIKDSYGASLSSRGNYLTLLNKNGTTVSAAIVPYASSAGSAGSVSWANVSNKPTTIDHATSADSANAVAWANVDGICIAYIPQTSIQIPSTNNSTYAFPSLSCEVLLNGSSTATISYGDYNFFNLHRQNSPYLEGLSIIKSGWFLIHYKISVYNLSANHRIKVSLCYSGYNGSIDTDTLKDTAVFFETNIGISGGSKHMAYETTSTIVYINAFSNKYTLGIYAEDIDYVSGTSSYIYVTAYMIPLLSY